MGRIDDDAAFRFCYRRMSSAGEPRLLSLGANCWFRTRLRLSLLCRLALGAMVRNFNLAEVESHAGNVLLNLVWGGQAAEIWGGL